MELLGEIGGYSAYKNSEGYIELFKQSGAKKNYQEVSNGESIKRIVTRFTRLEDVVLPKKKRVKSYDPYKDDNQLRIE